MIVTLVIVMFLAASGIIEVRFVVNAGQVTRAQAEEVCFCQN
jgi:hypothetical protein